MKCLPKKNGEERQSKCMHGTVTEGRRGKKVQGQRCKKQGATLKTSTNLELLQTKNIVMEY